MTNIMNNSAQQRVEMLAMFAIVSLTVAETKSLAPFTLISDEAKKKNWTGEWLQGQQLYRKARKMIVPAIC